MELEEILMLCNPLSGGGRAVRLAIVAEQRLTARGVRVRRERTGTRDQTAAMARSSGMPVVVACGGDGTVSAVAEGLAGTGTVLGILPGGRGNDFARVLGISRHPDAGARVLVEGTPAPIDVGRAGDRVFCTVASVGFDAEVARRAAGSHHPLGRLSYIPQVLRTLPGYRAERIRLRGDFGEVEGRFFLVAVGNTSTYGGGMMIVPPACHEDGMLHACLVADAARHRLLPILPRLFRGTHLERPEVRILESREFWMEGDRPLALFGDGEHLGETPIRLSAELHALRVMMPVPPARFPPLPGGNQGRGS